MAVSTPLDFVEFLRNREGILLYFILNNYELRLRSFASLGKNHKCGPFSRISPEWILPHSWQRDTGGISLTRQFICFQLETAFI